jgi:serine/threonine protein phosphatase PrpC
MQGLYDIGAGSMIGSKHLCLGNLTVGRNSQDSYRILQDEQVTIALVADGCGSQPHSEVGATDGVQLMASSLARQWSRYSALADKQGFAAALPIALEAARQDLLAHLRILAQAKNHGGSFSTVVCENYLFTLVGALIARQGCGFFSIGDGLIAVNGNVTQLGPFPENEPPYPAYALFTSRWPGEQLRFIVHQTLATGDLRSFLIGTDGVADLKAAAALTIPGTSEPIGSLEQFWTLDGYFTKTGIHRKLARIQSRHCSVRDGELRVDGPRLPDDTTMVVGRIRATA